MAIRPDWNVGTITLTAGSTAFTTTGSALLTAGVEAGDEIITPSGHVLIIGATPTSQNAGVLFLPCPAGAAGANLPLRIRFQPDGSRFQAAYRIVSEMLDNGNLEALAALTGVDGKLPMFTGAGTMGLIDKTALGIQDPNGSLAKLAAVTLAARQILQTDDKGALKALALAANKALTTNVNGDIALTDITALGRALLALTGTNGNIPVMTAAGTVASRPIVGTVSQSGGIPTGGIIEKGSNANGNYTRWADGTQICWQSKPFAISLGSWAFSPIFAWTYPASFLSGVRPALSWNASGPYSGSAIIYGAPTNTLFNANLSNVSLGTSNFDCVVDLVVTGRWF